MAAVIGVLAFFGFLVCIILTIVRAIRKRPVKPAAMGIAICFIVIIICAMITPSAETNQQTDNNEPSTTVGEPAESSESSSQQESTESKKEDNAETDSQSQGSTSTIGYDKLQSVFLSISFDTTEDVLLKLIEDNGLMYTSQKYNGNPKDTTYKLAYSNDVALQRYAKSGDHLEVSFDQETGTLLVAEYFNDTAFKEALLYNYGTYWDFREEEANNNYSGYYYYTPGDTEGGIEIKSSNGASTETGYHSAYSAEEALKNILLNN